MNKSKYKNKIYIRMLIVIIYLLFMIPLQFTIFPNRDSSFLNSFLKSFIIILFITLEFVEFFNYYSEDKLTLKKALFLIRVISLIAIFSFEYHLKKNIEPFFINLIPLIVFYSFFIMPSKFSISLLIIFCGFDVFFNNNNLLLQVLVLYFIIVLIFKRIIINSIFYLFAKFWQKDFINTIEREKLLLELEKSKNELKEYAKEISKISILEERTRIAREMHDSLGHSLTAIQIQLRKALAYINEDLDESKKAIEASIEVAAISLKDIRTVLNALSKKEVNFNLKNKIQATITILEQSDIIVDANIEENDETFNYTSFLALYRFTQECTTNILKHSKATKVNINLTYNKDEARLVISDNGIGFNLNNNANHSDISGMGLLGLKERFELIHGSFSVESECGKGTKIVASVPKDPVKLIGENNGNN